MEWGVSSKPARNEARTHRIILFLSMLGCSSMSESSDSCKRRTSRRECRPNCQPRLRWPSRSGEQDRTSTRPQISTHLKLVPLGVVERHPEVTCYQCTGGGRVLEGKGWVVRDGGGQVEGENEVEDPKVRSLRFCHFRSLESICSKTKIAQRRVPETEFA